MLLCTSASTLPNTIDTTAATAANCTQNLL